jgi:glutaminyl-tRNA synthetase
LAPGREVRLKHAYFLKCEAVVRNDAGDIVELRCTYDPATKSGSATDGRKVKGTLHWVSADSAVEAEVRLYEHLFQSANPAEEGREEGLVSLLNPNSLEVLRGCRVEPSLATAEAGERFQFLRHGYFCVDPDSAPGALVFNRTIGLRDSWSKIEKKQQPQAG